MVYLMTDFTYLRSPLKVALTLLLLFILSASISLVNMLSFALMLSSPLNLKTLPLEVVVLVLVLLVESKRLGPVHVLEFLVISSR